jgi:hypothetical protein
MKKKTEGRKSRDTVPLRRINLLKQNAISLLELLGKPLTEKLYTVHLYLISYRSLLLRLKQEFLNKKSYQKYSSVQD